MKPIENYGVKLLSMVFLLKPDQAVIWRGPMAAKALNQMIFDADWGELDFYWLTYLQAQEIFTYRSCNLCQSPAH